MPGVQKVVFNSTFSKQVSGKVCLSISGLFCTRKQLFHPRAQNAIMCKLFDKTYHNIVCLKKMQDYLLKHVKYVAQCQILVRRTSSPLGKNLELSFKLSLAIVVAVYNTFPCTVSYLLASRKMHQVALFCQAKLSFLISFHVGCLNKYKTSTAQMIPRAKREYSKAPK